MATIDITRASNGGVVITYNGKPKTISNPQNIVAKELTRVNEGTVITDGVVCKTTDEGFRQRIFKTDTITLGGVAFLGSVDDLILYLNQNIFGGSQAFATPAKLAQTIVLPAPPADVHTGPPVTLQGTTNSGLTIAYTSSNTAVFTIAGNVLTKVGAGTANIVANQAGDANYAAASQVTTPYTLT